MYNLPQPTMNSTDSFNASVATTKSVIIRKTYEGEAHVVRSRCESYDLLAAELKFNDARSENFKVPRLDEAMVKLYDNQFLNGARTKDIRDGLRNSAPNNLCPYCGEGIVSQLDHYLPKVTFTGTTVHPCNLVPACKDCNYAKLAYEPNSANPAVLHPYFDTAFNVRWLFASIEEGDLYLPVVVFSVNLNSSDPLLEARLNAHMNVFKLWHSFSIKASQLLNNFEGLLKTDFGRNMSLEQARLHLRTMAVQQSGDRVNSWEGATYTAMATCDWYLIRHLGLS